MNLAALFGGQVLIKVKTFQPDLKISLQKLHVKASSTGDVESWMSWRHKLYPKGTCPTTYLWTFMVRDYHQHKTPAVYSWRRTWTRRVHELSQSWTELTLAMNLWVHELETCCEFMLSQVQRELLFCNWVLYPVGQEVRWEGYVEVGEDVLLATYCPKNRCLHQWKKEVIFLSCTNWFGLLKRKKARNRTKVP